MFVLVNLDIVVFMAITGVGFDLQEYDIRRVFCVEKKTIVL